MATCPTCNGDLEGSEAVCPGCGTPQKQYKVVTFLYCDVAGSTALGGSLGPFLTSELMDEYGQTVRQVLGERGANVSKRHGDGFMAAFGVRELHEDDAFRAVQAATALRAAIGEISSRLQAERGVGLEVRIGVNTGEVLVVRDADTLEEQLVGTPADLTKRFEEAAWVGRSS
jgi:class 3 adenylate cyclase